MFDFGICSHQAEHCANHDYNMFVLSMIKTTSKSSSDRSQTKYFINTLLNAAMPFIPEGFATASLSSIFFWFTCYYKDFVRDLL